MEGNITSATVANLYYFMPICRSSCGSGIKIAVIAVLTAGADLVLQSIGKIGRIYAIRERAAGDRFCFDGHSTSEIPAHNLDFRVTSSYRRRSTNNTIPLHPNYTVRTTTNSINTAIRSISCCSNVTTSHHKRGIATLNIDSGSCTHTLSDNLAPRHFRSPSSTDIHRRTSVIHAYRRNRAI